MTATANIIVEKHANVLLISNIAIKGSENNYWVDVVIDEKTQTTEKRVITLGAQNDKLTEVISGLKEGEKVIAEITRAPTTLQPSSPQPAARPR